ncbi:diguanylate cyclase domain-containing protein [Wenzhouxiangella sp. EGI_FJ10305]|uniref:diguanylate cyclase domain-containing protein n=1 Tax=Wenzhouxiangella sp. EGI_FJ10305 TaxID=3243768 RepID=UPI0035E02B27
MLLVLSGVHFSAPAAPLSCGELPERAESIRAMRDHDPAAGVEQGQELLGRIDQAGLDCSAGHMAVQAAVASNLHILGRSQEAIDAVNAALSLGENVDDPIRLASVRRTAGVVFWEIGAHDRALEHYLAALEASRAAGDVGGAARAAGNVGNLHNTLGNWDEARSFHRQALEGFEEIGWREGIAGTLVNLGALAERMGESYAKAGEETRAAAEHQANLDYNRRALRLFEQLDNPRGIAYAADNIARALVELERVEEALSYHRQSLELRREVGDTTGVVNSLLTGAEARLAQGWPDSALVILEEARSLVPESNRELLRQVVRQEVAAYERLGDYESAFRRLERLMSLNDAQASEDLAARVEQLQEAFRADQLEQELALQRARVEVSEQRARRQQMISAASIITVVLLLLVLGLLYSRYRLGRRVSKTLDKAARTDSLTGLSNRRDMTEHIDRAILRRNQHNEPAALVMADIDSFKRINDSLGHQVGDEVLVHVAGLLGDHLRGVDIAARWGGEEFLILLPGTREKGAYSVSRNLARALDNSPPQVGGRPLSLTLTFGVTEIESGADFNDVIKRVDNAMYAGKSQGKNRVVSASELAT